MVRRFILFLIFISIFPGMGRSQSGLQLNSTFSTTENCNYKTKGIFVAWWDKDFDYADQADQLLNTLEEVQDDCLNRYHMYNPPNPIDGFYYNVYIHNGQDLFPDGWAMGQGTDTNGYPFLTIPVGYATTNNAGLQHEGFHIFQYNANSPGFAYSGDSQWFIEATANWYAALKHPNSKEEFVTASCITYNPHLPMWYTFDNKEPQDQANWQRYCHQYGMNILISYLTEVRDVSRDVMVSGFFVKTDELPQEYLFKKIGGENFRELFADYAAHNVGGFEFFPPGTESRTYQELKTYGDLNDTHPIVATYTNEGTYGEWITPKNDWVTRAWSYNVFKIENSQQAEYTFQLEGDAEGSEGAPAEFLGRLVVKNRESLSYYEMVMDRRTNGSISYQAAPDDAEIYLVIISTPDCFRGNQKFFYRVKIDQNTETSVRQNSIKTRLGNGYPNPADNETIIPYELEIDGEVILTLADQSGRIVVNQNEGHQSAGQHSLSLSTRDLRPGVYYYSLMVGDFNQTRSLVIQ